MNKVKGIEKGTLYVNGCNLGPTERDPATGNTESGPHVAARHAITSITSNVDARKPALVNARMSATEMVDACNLKLRRATLWTYSVYDADGRKLHTSTMTGIKAWLRREGYVA